MELLIPVQNIDFEFKKSPFPNSPLTPKPFGTDVYYSAPSSPSRLSEFYSELEREFYDLDMNIGHHDEVYSRDEDDLFAFEKVQVDLISEEELFGTLKPSKITTPLGLSKPTHESSDQNNKTRSPGIRSERERGRERVQNLSSSSRRVARSHSPIRDYKYSGEEEKEIIQTQEQPSTVEKSPSSSSNSSASSKSQKKWRFRDMFLFRNASDGRASENDLLKKYTATMRANERPVNAAGSTPRRKAPPVSAHELLYKENRAAREEQKKKTFLPYKAGVWGGMPFNPALANGLGFSHK